MTLRRCGGALWVGCLQFFVAEAVATAGFVGSYTYRRNYISDLGALSCGAGCSPRHALMNTSFVLQGVLIFAGALVVWPLFPRGALARLALGLIAASGLGVAIVGLAPEDAMPGWHYLGAAENLLFCNAGAALLGVALLREGAAPRSVGLLSLAFGLIGLGGLGGLAFGYDFGLGVGGVERLAAYPFPLWIAGMGAWLICGGEGRPGAPRDNGPDAVLFCYAAPSRRLSSASTRSSASRKACALATVPKLSFASFAPRGSALPRISRA